MAHARLLRGYSQRLAAFVALWALALNVVVGPVGAFEQPIRDAFGQPICAHHSDGADGQTQHPASPDGGASCCQCCCTSIIAIDTSRNLHLPIAVTWTRPIPVALQVHLPPIVRHPSGPPRGPPFA
jgi:hypothetical protein